jgi:hypothetical protein
MPSSTRRRYLTLLGSLGLAGLAGCLESAETQPQTAPSGGTQQPTPTPARTDEPTPPSEVKAWAQQATPTGPVRGEADPVSVERTIEDEPGYEEDNIEYFPENRTIRFVSVRSGGEPAGFDTWTFEEWGSIEAASVGSAYVQQVVADRLNVEALGSAVSRPPDPGTPPYDLVVTLSVDKVLNRQETVVAWPRVRFPDLVDATPRSVDVTLFLEGDRYTRTVPVYASYRVAQYQ